MWCSYVVERDVLHGLVLLQGVHLVQVAVCDEDSPVLRLVETVDLGNTISLIIHPTGAPHTHQTHHRELAATRKCVSVCECV